MKRKKKLYFKILYSTILYATIFHFVLLFIGVFFRNHEIHTIQDIFTIHRPSVYAGMVVLIIYRIRIIIKEHNSIQE